MDWLTTSTILDGLHDDRNEEAWEALVQRFREPVASFARRLGVAAQDAEDVAQETLLAFVQSYRAGRYDRSRGRLGKWLFGIAFNQVRAARRRAASPEGQAPATVGEISFWTALPDEAGATELWEVTWERHVALRCLERVRREVEPVTFAAFRETVIEDRSPAEAAEHLGVPVKTVYNAKHRVLGRLRRVRRELEDLEEAGDAAG